MIWSYSKSASFFRSNLCVSTYYSSNFLRAEAKAGTESDKNLPELSWNSEIRRYTLEPYQLIKDVRTGHEVSSDDVVEVLNGDLDG